MSNQFPLDVDVETVGPLLTRKATPSKSSSFDVLDLGEPPLLDLESGNELVSSGNCL